MPEFYQQLLSGIVSYEALGNRIVKQIKAAHAFRQVEQVKELSRVLINIPIREYQLIAQYYLVWCKCRDYEYPAATLETIIEQTKTYKTKALFSRGAVEWYKGENEAAIYFYTEALKTSPTISEYVDLSRTIAVLKATEGFHKLALRDLENLIPLIKHVEPRLYYDFLNSYAVELGEAGRMYEAGNISRIVLASPFAYAYPEWQATANDLRGRSRSFAAINQHSYLPRKVLHMPAGRHVSEEIEQGQQARVLSLQAWKKKMAKKKEPPPKHEGDMLMRIISVFSSDETNDYERHKMYEAVMKALDEARNPKPDDDSEGA